MRSLAKRTLKATGLWEILKYLLPKYHRPWGRVALSRIGTLFGPNREALARAYLGLAKLQRYEDALPQAIASYNAAVAYDPHCADGDFIGEVHMASADKLIFDLHIPERLDEADRHCAAALKAAPERWDFHMRAGGIFRHSGQYYEKSAGFWARGLALKRDEAKKRNLDSLGIRFIGHTWAQLIGHIASLDTYVKTGLLGLRPPQRTVLVMQPSLQISNRCLLDYWRPYIDFVEDYSALNISREDAQLLTDEYYAAIFPDGNSLWHGPWAAAVQKNWETEKRPPLLSLSPADMERGKDCLRELGVPEGAWYICLHVRDNGFAQDLDLKHPSARNADIATYFQAIQSITSQGGWVIRLGDRSTKPLPPMEHVVDYAHSERKSDWMDVFLAASCRFFIGLGSGFSWVPAVFGVPVVGTNWVPMGFPPVHGNSLWIPKLCWSERERRHLRFDEVFSSGLGFQDFQRQFDCRGVTLTDNTSEEINAVTLEMLHRLDGSFESTPEDERMRQDFVRLVEARGSRGARLGRNFLRGHSGLLALKEEPKQIAFKS